ncbi:MAG TPA: bifunctional hydroxymethylpyrimidine kinase/phosphomethylpyrimidine kinase [Micromonosporaceae bacterium]|nr:bifunctional hydroxymethylpyrimidine kinase/phosphomethylpyrimidine kinase [Micromonosporaceae bacterium]
MEPPVVLTIGGSDSCGGSGIQADLKTLSALRVYGASVITAVTAQNTYAIGDLYPIPATVISAQLNAVLDDLRLAAVKTGMLANAEAAAAVAARARGGALPNLVVDPVLVSSAGFKMGVTAAVERLLPYALVVTPNREQASALVGWQVATPTEMAQAASQIAAGGPKYVVVTGGDLMRGDEAIDAVWFDGTAGFLHGPRIATRNTLGCGASFASAIAARIALGDGPADAIRHAKGFVGRALSDAAEWRLGAGTGPLDHFGWSSFTLT